MDAGQVLVRLGPRAALSHESAARCWGIELVERGPERVTVPRSRGRARAAGWALRRADLPGDDVVVVEGLRCTTPLRTVLDLARVLPCDEAVAAADSALRQGLVAHEELRARLGGCRGSRASGPRAVAALAHPLAESVLESLVRVVLARAGLPAPQVQHVVRERDGTFVARVDLCWPQQRLVVEADGFAFHSDRAAFRSDRTRLKALERLGWRVLRFSWEDARSRPTHLVATVRDCLALAA